jgi:hypothetical protein
LEAFPPLFADPDELADDDRDIEGLLVVGVAANAILKHRKQLKRRKI